MGHANNSRYLTYCESARIAYWEAATGEPMALVTHGAQESLILADIRVSFRSPVYFGEMLTVESRVGADRADVSSRSSTGSRRGEPSGGHARLVATAEGVQVLYDYADGRPREIPPEVVAPARGLRGPAASADRASAVDGEAAEDRHRVLAAEPEAVDGDRVDLRLARHERHVVEVALRVGRVQVRGRAR